MLLYPYSDISTNGQQQRGLHQILMIPLQSNEYVQLDGMSQRNRISLPQLMLIGQMLQTIVLVQEVLLDGYEEMQVIVIVLLLVHFEIVP